MGTALTEVCKLLGTALNEACELVNTAFTESCDLADTVYNEVPSCSGLCQWNSERNVLECGS